MAAGSNSHSSSKGGEMYGSLSQESKCTMHLCCLCLTPFLHTTGWDQDLQGSSAGRGVGRKGQPPQVVGVYVHQVYFKIFNKCG